jgi:hypothetical protein
MRVQVQSLASGVKRSARPLAVMAIALASATIVLPAMMPASAAVSPASTLTTTQLSTIQSQVQDALAGISPSLTGVARIQAVNAALVAIATRDTASMGAAAIDAIVSDAILAGVTPTTVVDAVIRGAIAGGVPGSTAIADVMLAAIHDGAPAANVTAQVIATGTAIPLPPDVTGTGLGMAAAALSRTDILAATAIGQTVANEGTQPLRVAYENGVLANGGSVALADLGNSFPLATGETGLGRGIDNGLNNNAGGNRNQGNDFGDQGNANNQQANTNQNLPPCTGPSCS